ncbi:MAG: hypothetical protein GY816_00840, partial [Cytophagales bacterium]|nr:hypothetical protein [Cytophagales bacterium]
MRGERRMRNSLVTSVLLNLVIVIFMVSSAHSEPTGNLNFEKKYEASSGDDTDFTSDTSADSASDTNSDTTDDTTTDTTSWDLSGTIQWKSSIDHHGYDSQGGFAGVWNPETETVVWKSSIEHHGYDNQGGFAGVWNPETKTVVWKSSINH